MRCLFCYKELQEGELHYHAACAKRFFGTQEIPSLPYSQANLRELAKQVVRSQSAVTGVQAKLSMDIMQTAETARLTIVETGGRYILKPQTMQYPFLPENEDLTMHLAEMVKIDVVPHTLFHFDNGEYCYLTKRIVLIAARGE